MIRTPNEGVGRARPRFKERSVCRVIDHVHVRCVDAASDGHHWVNKRQSSRLLMCAGISRPRGYKKRSAILDGGLQNQLLVHEFSKSGWNRDAP
jgi:hypothetical protein